MEAEKMAVKKHKKSSKRLHSFSSRSDDEDSRKKGYFKPSSVFSKRENMCDKSYLDVKEDRTKELESRIERKRKRKKGKVKEKRSESEEYSSSSLSESEKRKKKKRKEKKRKEKKRKKKHKKEKVEGMNNLNLGSRKKFGEGINKAGQKEMDNNFQSGPNPANSTEEPKRRMAPMTKEEYDIQQSKVRRVFDPDTGRERLIKGDGEVIEEVVSYERHKAINKLSTAGDGAVFQKSLGLNR